MTSRNQPYESAQKQRGLVKVTLWVPASSAPVLKLAVSLLVDNPDLSLSVLRHTKTGRFVSIEQPSLVTL